MLRIILTAIIAVVLVFSFGCKKTNAPQAPATMQKQAQDEITKENMDQQLDKIEKEIRTDVNAQ